MPITTQTMYAPPLDSLKSLILAPRYKRMCVIFASRPQYITPYVHTWALGAHALNIY
jgi:hypothetical protein